MARTKQTACKGTAVKLKSVTFGDKPDKIDGNGDDVKSKGKPG